MIRTLTTFDFDALLGEASRSPRRRAIYRLHEHEEPVQRMLNAMLPGTYVQPHKHEAPDRDLDHVGVTIEIHVPDLRGDQ